MNAEKQTNTRNKAQETTIIHACATSIVLAVGVTKTVSHPYAFQSFKSY